MTRRQKAILRRNLFFIFTAIILILVVCFAVFCIKSLKGDNKENSSQNTSSASQTSIVSSETVSSEDQSSSEVLSQTESAEEITAPHGLDADFKILTVVNGWNPLPKDYDYEGNLTKIPQRYIKGSLTQIDKDVWPYLKAMLDDALAEGIDIGVWSPYRSYETQKWLFERQVQKQINNGVPKSKAEDKAATIVARPGTSEHNTGYALDINCANDSFESTKAYKWLKKNAENYGFVMRYSKEKQEKTGVIHESWHWRFVGVKPAHEMNKLNMCLEEYVEYIK